VLGFVWTGTFGSNIGGAAGTVQALTPGPTGRLARIAASSCWIEAACWARRSFSLAGISVCKRARSLRMKSRTLSFCASRRAVSIGVVPGGQRAAEQPVERRERLRLRVQRLAGAGDVGLARERVEIRHHARRDLVAVGADVGRQLQRSHLRLGERRRSPQHRRSRQQDLIDGRAARAPVLLADLAQRRAGRSSGPPCRLRRCSHRRLRPRC
jgi:hypothetical protein